MAECLNVIVDAAASLSLSNEASGKYWSRCPAGYLQRSKAFGWVVRGSGGISAGVPVCSGFTLDLKIDQRPIVHLDAPTAFVQAATGTNAPAAMDSLIRGLIPINDVMVSGEEINLEVTSPANGEAIAVLVMELVALGEVVS